MKYFKITDDKYILGIYTAKTGRNPISKEEYFTIKDVLDNAPLAEDGYGYRLKLDLTWEQYAINIEEDNQNDI